jgi:hypothetical protein
MTFSTNPTQPMVSEIFLYARRILKQPNPEDISDSVLADYLSRFIVYDVPARVQLFDFKTQYTLELTPNIDQYNAPVTILPGGAVIPTYQTYITPAYIDGYQIVMQQSHDQWMKLFPNRVYNQYQQNGTGISGPYNISLYEPPVIQGHVDQNVQPSLGISSPITNITQATQAVVTSVNSFTPGQFVVISGVVGMTQLNGNTYQVVNSTGSSFTLNVNSTGFGAYTSGGVASITINVNNQGLLTSSVYVSAFDVNNNLNVAQDLPINYTTGSMIQYDPLNPGNPPSIVGTVNYLTGAITVTFLYQIPSTSQINSQSIPYSAGRPQAVFFFDNTFTMRPIPDKPYLFQIDAYYNPAAFLASSNAIPFRFMTEYFARGTARKILQDYGDVEQLQLYEPFFREQENFVLRKTYRQNSNTRVATVFQGQTSFNPGSYNSV